jgi:hypothetical protein
MAKVNVVTAVNATTALASLMAEVTAELSEEREAHVRSANQRNAESAVLFAIARAAKHVIGLLVDFNFTGPALDDIDRLIKAADELDQLLPSMPDVSAVPKR